jgi:hypothetical protein
MKAKWDIRVRSHASCCKLFNRFLRNLVPAVYVKRCREYLICIQSRAFDKVHCAEYMDLKEKK